jgi:hypothetical protein
VHDHLYAGYVLRVFSIEAIADVARRTVVRRLDVVTLESLLREEERVRARSGRRGEGLEWGGRGY